MQFIDGFVKRQANINLMSLNLQLNRQAHITHFTMEEIVTATYSTYSTPMTMVLVFDFIVE